jgi:hypothetical protein
MRILKISALALACAAGGLALSQAKAAPPDAMPGPQSRIDRMCSSDAKPDKMAGFMEKRVARLSTLLQLNDSQKAALKDLEDARAKGRSDFKTTICANKPDLSSFPNRLAFREQMMQRRLDAFKAETPKLIAFYNSLDDKQKAAFEAMRDGMMGGRHGAMMGRGPGGPGRGHGMGGMGGDMGGPDGGPPEE